MLANSILQVMVISLAISSASAQEAVREIRRSPDKQFYVGWFDHDAGAPFGVIRPIVVRSASDSYDIFSLVSSPRYTDAAWNAGSSRCIIADAPDNGGPRTWLVYQKSPIEWASREISPFSVLEREHLKANPNTFRLFRPSIMNIQWLTNTTVRFRGYCNSGTYFITVDTSLPEMQPQMQKLSDKWLDDKEPLPGKTQASAGQPAAKPADKPPVKNQPSTPTSKDGRR